MWKFRDIGFFYLEAVLPLRSPCFFFFFMNRERQRFLWRHAWAWVASTFRDLKQDFGFWREIEVRPSAESWPLGFISRKWISTEKPKLVKQVKHLLEGRRVHVNRHTLTSTERRVLVVLLITFMRFSSGFPLAKHLALADSESMFCIYQCLPMCVTTFLSQDGF